MHDPSKQPCFQALDEAIQFLSDFKLKLAGNSFLNDVWTSDVPITKEMSVPHFFETFGSLNQGSFDRHFQSKSEYDVDYSSFRNLKDLLKVVESLNQVLSRKVSQMSDALLPPSRHYGLASIPNEIFIRIMDYAAMSCTDYASIMALIKDLSSVSRHFRAGVISATSFWNYWDNDYCSDDGFQHRLARTKKSPIFLDLFVKSRTTMMKRTLKRILPHASRCHHLTLQAPWKLEDKFFADWMFPNMLLVKFIGVLPPPGTFPNITSLTSCNKAGEYIFTHAYLPKFTSLLHSMSCLTALDLDVSFVVSTYTSTKLPPVELPNVSTFRIGNHHDLPLLKSKSNHLTRIDSVGDVASLLKLPNVETFFLGLSFRSSDDHWVSTIFPEGTSFDAARDFHLTVMSTSDDKHELSFEGFSTHFPNLSSLRVDRFVRNDVAVGPGSFRLEKSFDPFDGCFPQLHSFDLVGIEKEESGG